MVELYSRDEEGKKQSRKDLAHQTCCATLHNMKTSDWPLTALYQPYTKQPVSPNIS